MLECEICEYVTALRKHLSLVFCVAAVACRFFLLRIHILYGNHSRFLAVCSEVIASVLFSVLAMSMYAPHAYSLSSTTFQFTHVYAILFHPIHSTQYTDRVR